MSAIENDGVTLDTVADCARSAADSCLSLGTLHFQEANELVREALAGSDAVELQNVCAQRYLGCAMPAGKRLAIFGTPGNDMACYMDGGEIEVYGNAQDQIGNTMNDGTVVVHGSCGDAAGYAMRGGSIFIRDNCGWRVGIHMKQFEDRRPAIVIGGNAGDFLGKNMAGGIIVLMGHAGRHVATGMHGGCIYLQHPLEEFEIADGLVQEPVDEDDERILAPLLSEYCKHFAGELADARFASSASFYRLRPASSRPYASLYAN